MKAVVVGIVVACLATRAGAAVLEGTVAVPADSGVAVKARYPVAATYEVGEADPPAAIVFVEGSFPTPPADGASAEVAQSRYQFAPGLLAIRRGTVVRFPNRDDEYHSVFSYSKARRFDLGRYQRDETAPTLRFEQTGIVRLFCEIHDHMRGTILVLDTPYFTRTEADGRYRLDGLPAGRWVLKAWIDEDTVRERPVILQDGATARADFE